MSYCMMTASMTCICKGVDDAMGNRAAARKEIGMVRKCACTCEQERGKERTCAAMD
jgi:hypothetical protein